MKYHLLFSNTGPKVYLLSVKIKMDREYYYLQTI